MVYYFTSDASGTPHTIYMGRDKFENELLIKHGWDEDVWFHAGKLSSAHVYLRLETGQKWDEIDELLIQDLGQLTKANSIAGNKLDNMVVIYTPWSNLKKSGDMDVGQVSFHNHKLVKRFVVPTRLNDIVNRLNKTRAELDPDFAQEKLDHEIAIRRAEKEQMNIERKEQERYIAGRRKEKEQWDYSHVIKEEAMYSNKGVSVEELEDDFM